MIYLELLVTFLQIGAFSFGGGYGLISLMREQALSHGWLSEAELLNIVAVAESTPGPIAVNMATFVGSSQGGVLGALCATLGVVLPSFLVILLIATLFRRFLKYAGVKAVLSGVRPCVVGLILATGATMLLGTVVGTSDVFTAPSVDVKGAVILAVLVIVGFLGGKYLKKQPFLLLHKYIR